MLENRSVELIDSDPNLAIGGIKNHLCDSRMAVWCLEAEFNPIEELINVNVEPLGDSFP